MKSHSSSLSSIMNLYPHSLESLFEVTHDRLFYYLPQSEYLLTAGSPRSKSCLFLFQTSIHSIYLVLICDSHSPWPCVFRNRQQSNTSPICEFSYKYLHFLKIGMMKPSLHASCTLRVLHMLLHSCVISFANVCPPHFFTSALTPSLPADFSFF